MGSEIARRTVEALKADPNAFASVNQAAGEAAQIAETVLRQGRKEYYRLKTRQRHQL